MLNSGGRAQEDANRCLLCLARIGDLMYGRDEQNAAGSCSALFDEIAVQRHRLARQRLELRRELERQSHLLSSDSPSTVSPTNPALQNIQKAYGVTLLFCIFLDKAWQSLVPKSSELHAAESDRLVGELLQNIDQSMVWLPIGVSWISIALSAAWIGTDNPSLRSDVQALLNKLSANCFSITIPTHDLDQVSKRFKELSKRQSLG